MEGFRKIGQLSPVNGLTVQTSRIGLGFEKLDRGAFDPEKAYDKVAATGAKWIRIQSGWARTEKQKGVYDFAWLDSVVDNLLARGLKPWICLCYGNGIYDERAAKVYGAVGYAPMHTEEAKQAWRAYVKALVTRYQGKVSDYEIWNEPDGQWCWKNGVSGKEYGEFMVWTSKAIREVDESVRIIGGSICISQLSFIDDALRTGAAQYLNAITFHEYTADETRVYERVRTLRALVKRHNPAIEIIQGESGSQSKRGGAGALRGGAWTQKRQAKQLLRHTLADLMSDVLFASYFSALDMVEALNGTVGDKNSYMDFGYFGILGADFDEDGVATGEYSPKMSYYALQNLCAVFAGEFSVCDLPILSRPQESMLVFGRDCDEPSIARGGFARADGSWLYAYWNATDLMTTEYESTYTVEVAALPANFALIDPMDGSIYDIGEENIVRTGECSWELRHLPIYDYPLLLVSKDAPFCKL